MSRYREYDNDEPEAILDYGRWERNARVALKGKRGRKALAEMREALLALPQKRLIHSALCTVGGPERIPEVTEAEIDQCHAQREALGLSNWGDSPAGRRDSRAEELREDRQDQRNEIADLVARNGEGVCALGAFLWHRKVRAGMNPAGAFASLPTVAGDSDSSDPMTETANLGKQAGLTFTLAWELAYRNDETYELKTPEERYTAFLAWIDAELAAVPA